MSKSNMKWWYVATYRVSVFNAYIFVSESLKSKKNEIIDEQGGILDINATRIKQTFKYDKWLYQRAKRIKFEQE